MSGEEEMKAKASVIGILFFLVFSVMSEAWGQRPTRSSAWENLLRADPTAADDPAIGWRERLILHALTPEQAEAYFQKGADPQSLLLDSGQTLQEYLDGKLNPAAAGFVSLPVPCSLLVSDPLEGGQRYGVRVRGNDLSRQGGSATGCGIPNEATAVILEVTLEDPAPGTRLKLWTADGPEPVEAVLEAGNESSPAIRKTVVVTLAQSVQPDGDLLLEADLPAAAKAEVVGYFRALRTGDAPGGGIQFYVESSGRAIFGEGAGAVNTANNIAFLGGNTGHNNTTGTYNTFVGQAAGYYNTTGSQNTFVGLSAGLFNSTASDNSAFGYYAGYANSTGTRNAFFGSEAGRYSVSSYNSFFGYRAGYTETTGNYNSYFGDEAGFSNSAGDFNSFFGRRAGYSNTGSYNSFFGHHAGYYNTGHSNSFFGYLTGYNNTSGAYNVFSGRSAGYLNSTGDYNTFFGYSSGYSNTVENGNTFLGHRANLDPGANPAGSPVDNATAIGQRAYVSQSNSLVLGSIAGVNGATDSVNVGIGTSAPQARFHVENMLGNDTDDFVVTSTGKVGVGTVAPANGVHVKGDAPGFIFEESDWGNQKWQMAALNGEWRIRDLTGGNVYPFRISPGIGGTALMINPVGNVGIGTDAPAFKLHVIGSIFATGGVASSRQLKDDIRPLSLEDAVQTLVDLEPVQFRYKDDPNHDLQLGFIAEDVPELVSTPGRTGVQPMDIIAVLVKTAQDQLQKLGTVQEELRQKDLQLADQKAEIQELKARVQEMAEVKSELAEIRSLLRETAQREGPEVAD
jgi:hypothetical protein